MPHRKTALDEAFAQLEAEEQRSREAAAMAGPASVVTTPHRNAYRAPPARQLSKMHSVISRLPASQARRFAKMLETTLRSVEVATFELDETYIQAAVTSALQRVQQPGMHPSDMDNIQQQDNGAYDFLMSAFDHQVIAATKIQRAFREHMERKHALMLATQGDEGDMAGREADEEGGDVGAMRPLVSARCSASREASHVMSAPRSLAAEVSQPLAVNEKSLEGYGSLASSDNKAKVGTGTSATLGVKKKVNMALVEEQEALAAAAAAAAQDGGNRNNSDDAAGGGEDVQGTGQDGGDALPYSNSEHSITSNQAPPETELTETPRPNDITTNSTDGRPTAPPQPAQSPRPPAEVKFEDMDPMDKARLAMKAIVTKVPALQPNLPKGAKGTKNARSARSTKSARSTADSSDESSASQSDTECVGNGEGEVNAEALASARDSNFAGLLFGGGLGLVGDMAAAGDAGGEEAIAAAIRARVSVMMEAMPSEQRGAGAVEDCQQLLNIRALADQAAEAAAAAEGTKAEITAALEQEVARIIEATAAVAVPTEKPLVNENRDRTAWRKRILTEYEEELAATAAAAAELQRQAAEAEVAAAAAEAAAAGAGNREADEEGRPGSKARSREGTPKHQGASKSSSSKSKSRATSSSKQRPHVSPPTARKPRAPLYQTRQPPQKTDTKDPKSMDSKPRWGGGGPKVPAMPSRKGPPSATVNAAALSRLMAGLPVCDGVHVDALDAPRPTTSPSPHRPLHSNSEQAVKMALLSAGQHVLPKRAFVSHESGGTWVLDPAFSSSNPSSPRVMFSLAAGALPFLPNGAPSSPQRSHRSPRRSGSGAGGGGAADGLAGRRLGPLSASAVLGGGSTPSSPVCFSTGSAGLGRWPGPDPAASIFLNSNEWGGGGVGGDSSARAQKGLELGVVVPGRGGAGLGNGSSTPALVLVRPSSVPQEGTTTTTVVASKNVRDIAVGGGERGGGGGGGGGSGVRDHNRARVWRTQLRQAPELALGPLPLSPTFQPFPYSTGAEPGPEMTPGSHQSTQALGAHPGQGRGAGGVRSAHTTDSFSPRGGEEGGAAAAALSYARNSEPCPYSLAYMAGAYQSEPGRSATHKLSHHASNRRVMDNVAYSADSQESLNQHRPTTSPTLHQDSWTHTADRSASPAQAPAHHNSGGGNMLHRRQVSDDYLRFLQWGQSHKPSSPSTSFASQPPVPPVPSMHSHPMPLRSSTPLTTGAIPGSNLGASIDSSSIPASDGGWYKPGLLKKSIAAATAPLRLPRIVKCSEV